MFYTGWIFEYLIPSGWYGFIRLKTGLVWQTQVSRRESIHKCSLLPSTKMNKVLPVTVTGRATPAALPPLTMMDYIYSLLYVGD